MLLSSQHLNDIVGSLKKRSKSAGSERRRVPRVEVRARISLGLLVEGRAGKRFSALVRDISAEGMGLLSALPLQKGQKFVALIPRNDTETIHLICDVLHCGMIADGLFSIGCKYARPLTKQEAMQMETAANADIDRIRKSVLE